MLDHKSSTQGEIPDIPFELVIDALLDTSNPFPPKYLYRLSDIEGKELSQLKTRWLQIEKQRRLGLIEDLENLVESNFLVSFDSVFKLGLLDPYSDIRLASIRALWECEDATLIPQLINILKYDESISARAQAASGLGHFILLGEVGKIQEKNLDKIIEVLIEVLSDRSQPQVGQCALESLGFSSHPKISQLIEEAYDSEDEDWLISSLIAMGRSDDEQWHPLVVDNLGHSNNMIRLMATQAAGKLIIPEATPILFHLLDDEDDEVQMAAVWSLSEIGGGDVKEVLENLLENTEDEETIEIIDNALDNLYFNEGLEDFNFMDFSHDDDLGFPDTDIPNKE